VPKESILEVERRQKNCCSLGQSRDSIRAEKETLFPVSSTSMQKLATFEPTGIDLTPVCREICKFKTLIFGRVIAFIFDKLGIVNNCTSIVRGIFVFLVTA
jgi:hypothetical protein